MSDDVGVVAIGRNEGERLVRCLRSLQASACPVVYVDSQSTDGSPARARKLGARVVELDGSRPLSAARGRNAGFVALCDAQPQIRYVQFVDGDCELADDWIETARAYLDEHEDVAVACGRRRERFPEASPYNQLADMEWNTAIGESHACGGDALMRAEVVRDIAGYDERLIAGEDPELCMRIRRAGHRIVRLDREMTLHDAELERFGQWWRRQVRSGHAYAELVHRERGATEPQFAKQLRSILFWGGAVPLAAIVGAPFFAGASLLLLGALPLLALRIYRGQRACGAQISQARLYAVACALGKLAEFQGVATYAWNHLVLRRATTLLEYKDAHVAADDGSGATKRTARNDLAAPLVEVEQVDPKEPKVDA
jgi:GT2 family glycosyltransferase